MRGASVSQSCMMGDVFDEEEDRLMIDDAVDVIKHEEWVVTPRLHNTDCKEEGELDDDEELVHAQLHCAMNGAESAGMTRDTCSSSSELLSSATTPSVPLLCSSSTSSESSSHRPLRTTETSVGKKTKKKRTAEQDNQPSASTSSVPESAKRKKQIRDKACNVSTRAVQTTENDVDVSLGSTHCLDFTVLAKVPGPTSDSLYFVTNWNGRELYGILGDGLPSLHQAFQHKRSCLSGNSNGDVAAESSTIPHERTTWATPPKKKSQRGQRTSSCASSESKPSRKGTELVDLHEEDTSQSPVSWLCAGGTDPLYGVGTGAIGTATGLAQLTETKPQLCCPVPGCGYRFETTAQLCLHHSHHMKHRVAIYTETMGSQTDSTQWRDAATDPIPELNKDSLRPQLSNSEERSITELFQVAHRKEKSSSTKSTALDALERMGAGLLSEPHESKSVSSCLPLAGSPVFSDLSDDAPTLEKEVLDKSETHKSGDRCKAAVQQSPLSVSSCSDKLCAVDKSSVGLMPSASAPPSSAPSTSSSEVLMLPSVKHKDLKTDNKQSPTLHSPRISPAVTNMKPHPTAPSRPVSLMVGQSSGVQERNNLLQQQHAHYLMQQQMQLQMQMRLGPSLVFPGGNAAMAQQAYEQLVAMHTGITPANLGLFTPQPFQPK